MEDPTDHIDPHPGQWTGSQASPGSAGPDGGDPGPDSPQPVRCVLLAEPTRGDAPPALLEALRRRRLEVSVCHSTFDALAQIVGSVDEVDDMRRAAALVVIDPIRTNQERLRELLDALDVFAPRTVRWEFDESAPIKLHALHAPPRPSVHVRPGVGDAAARSAAAARLARQPELRLTGVDETFARPAPEDIEEKQSAELLSEAEIDMLLSDDAEDRPT